MTKQIDYQKNYQKNFNKNYQRNYQGKNQQIVQENYYENHQENYYEKYQETHEDKLQTDLIERVHNLNRTLKEPININIIEGAIRDTKKWHGKQKRATGEPYYTHPLKVATYVLDHEPTTETVVAALFHDILEDTSTSKSKIKDLYGEDIALQVWLLTRKRKAGEITAIESMFLMSMNSKKKLLLIKVMDRLHNMQTIHGKREESRIRIAKETLDYFVPACKHLKTDYPAIGIIEKEIKSLSLLHVRHNFS